MSTSVSSRARNHYRNQQKVAIAGVRAVRQAVLAAKTPDDATTATTTTLATYQLAAAVNGARTMASEAGRGIVTAPAQYAGTTQLGYPIEMAIETIIDRLTEDLDGELERLTVEMLGSLDLFVQSEVIASGVDASSVEIVAEPDWTNYVRVLVLPSCKRCVGLAGRIYRDLDGFARHPKCFPAGTVVSGPGARGATRRWYEGELVVIRTAGGKELSATANHPVLTDKGWVPVHLLAEGSHVVSRARGDRSGSLLVPHHDQMPARIEDLWRSDGMSSLGRVPVAAEDFHGDGLGSSHVDVVLADGFLRDREQIAFLEEAREEQLAVRTEVAAALLGSSSRQELFGRHGLSPLRSLGGGNLRGAGLRHEFAGSQQTRLSRMSDSYPGLEQMAAHGSTRYAVALGDREFGFPGFVLSDEHGNVQNAFTTRWDAPAVPFSSESAPSYAAVGHDLRHRMAGQVELDRVVEVSRIGFRGHVYNLTSSEGWYDAEGIIVSNCDCQHWPVKSWAAAERAGLVTDPMTAFERGQVTGLSEADARAISDGADFNAVANTTRGGGRRPPGMTNAVTAEIFGRTVKATLEGTTKRSEWRRKHPNLPIRLRPESIYEHAKDRDDALRLLRLYGYLPELPASR